MTKQQVPLGDALTVARAVRERLHPWCVRIDIAGSIRRRRPEVGDIELVALPRYEDESVAATGMFDGPTTRRVNLLAVAVDELVRQGDLADHPEDHKRGERYAKLVHPPTGMQIDLFMPGSPGSYGLIYLIRTGPAAYSQELVTRMKAGRPAHHVAGGELHVGTHCWGPPCEVVPTPNEQDVYAALGIPFVAPEDRG